MEEGKVNQELIPRGVNPDLGILALTVSPKTGEHNPPNPEKNT